MAPEAPRSSLVPTSCRDQRTVLCGLLLGRCSNQRNARIPGSEARWSRPRCCSAPEKELAGITGEHSRNRVPSPSIPTKCLRGEKKVILSRKVKYRDFTRGCMQADRTNIWYENRSQNPNSGNILSILRLVAPEGCQIVRSANWDIATVHFLCPQWSSGACSIRPAPLRQHQKQNRAPALINHHPSTLLNVGWLRYCDEWPSVSGSGPPNGKSTYTTCCVSVPYCGVS